MMVVTVENLIPFIVVMVFVHMENLRTAHQIVMDVLSLFQMKLILIMAQENLGLCSGIRF